MLDARLATIAAVPEEVVDSRAAAASAKAKAKSAQKQSKGQRESKS